MASNVGERETAPSSSTAASSEQQDSNSPGPVTQTEKNDPNIIIYDEDHETWKRQLKQILSSDYQQCHMCGGFYGSNHSQPLCSTCHLFLTSSLNLEDEEEFYSKSKKKYKNEEVDSGTDSPLEPASEDEMLAAVLDGERAQLPQPDELPAALAAAEAIEGAALQGAAAGDDRRREVRRGASAELLDELLESVVDGRSLHFSTVYRISLRPPLRDRVKDLAEYSPDSYGAAMGGLVDTMPPEVLMKIFYYINDDMTLHSVMNVCSKWAELIDMVVTDNEWQMHVGRRWPLFKPHFRVDSWKDIHTMLTNSSACQRCLADMKILNYHVPLPMLEKELRHRRLQCELKSIQKEPLEGIRCVPLDKECNFFQALINGPRGSPYEGGKFYLYLQVPKSYPLKPPHIQFITKVLHPNVSRHGDIGLDSIHHNWSLALTLSKILLSIQSLLTDPYLKVCMEPAVARLYQEERFMFNKMARTWTWKYAMAEVQQVYFGHVDLEMESFIPFAARKV